MIIRRLLLPSLLLVGLVLQATPATADVISGVNLYWDSLTVTPIGIGGEDAPVFSWVGSGSGTASSYAQTAFPDDYLQDDQSADDLTTELSVSLTTAKAQASATRGANTLSASAASQVGTDPEAGYNYAGASAGNGREFSLTGYGIALITLQWDASLGTPSDSFDEASVYASMYAEYDDGAFNQGGVISSTWRDLAESGAGEWSGTLSLTISNLVVGATTVGNFAAEVSADTSSINVVPEPASCVLMAIGLGIVGWIGYRRRK